MNTMVEPKPFAGEVVRPGKSVIPTRIKIWYVLACIAVFCQGALFTLGGVFFLSRAQDSASQFAAGVVLVLGVVFSVLGVFVVRKSKGALIAAVVIYSITVLLGLMAIPDVSNVIEAVLFLTPMIGGIAALNKMKKLEAAYHAVPTYHAVPIG